MAPTTCIMLLAGSLMAHDKYNIPVVMEWQHLTMLSQEYAIIMKRVAPLAVEAFLPVEIEFLRTHTSRVGVDPFFKPLEDHFSSQLSLDWTYIEKTMRDMLIEFFDFNPTLLTKEQQAIFEKDQYIVTIREFGDRTILGYITFLIKPEYKTGDVNASVIAVAPVYQRRGLGKLLMSSIFTILPTTKRIFLHTRITDANALYAYKKWGFSIDQQPLQYPDYMFNSEDWIFMEYQANTAQILEQTALSLQHITHSSLNCCDGHSFMNERSENAFNNSTNS